MKKNKQKLSTTISRFFLRKYKSFKQNRVDLNSTNARKSIRTLLSSARYVFVITSSNANQVCNARYVQPIVEWREGNFKVWIGTSASSRKITEISADSNVSLAIGSYSSNANLIVHGKATVHTDQSIRFRYWKPEWRLFFPDGPKDPDYTVICVEPIQLELMDIKRNVIPEPFGLRPLQLVLQNQQWTPVIDKAG